MHAADFKAFLDKMGWSDAEALRRLGIGSHNTLAGYKQNGGPVWLGLACAAAAAGLPPWKSDLVLVHAFRVWSQQAGDHLVGPSWRTAESIERLGGEVVPGTAIYADPADVDANGRLTMSDADRFYSNRLVVVANADEMPEGQIKSFVSDVSHLHAVEGRGSRPKLLRLFKAQAPATKTAQLIAEALVFYS